MSDLLASFNKLEAKINKLLSDGKKEEARDILSVYKENIINNILNDSLEQALENVEKRRYENER